MRQLQIISCQPNDLLFCWQLRVQCNNFREMGYSHLYHPIILYSKDRKDKEDFAEQWAHLYRDFPEVTFHVYSDKKGQIFKMINTFGYVPLLRPWLLHEHWLKHPELEECAILYLDSDVLFTKPLDFTPFLDDDICYLSDTNSYINASYFDGKIEKVRPEMLKTYERMDILQQAMATIGVDRAVADENNENSGGAQYLLKNIDAKFWANVLDGCMMIKLHLATVNQRYFIGNTPTERENNGFQSWCADMWSVLWNLWKRGQVTRCPKEMDFAWATDDITKLKDVYLYHDAGGGKENGLFNKRDENYVNNYRTPFEDDLSYVPKDKASYYYTQEIIKAKQSFDNQNQSLWQGRAQNSELLSNTTKMET